ncbi:hypothetical protein GCM10009678_90120 [Actinomadura kijaniata]|uniref:Cell wall-active antibiotics response LiaF-like C-terminal domain-containing protein n=1 Tax=Actinomadura namibiensis TaxID=182080 RepID=A0A7W3QNM1_ACTNM|nr:DUF1707 domain-containing protein [Actinomadura namibiensis]MBA8953744.1 hypothetical protein [Actinomadura namibiensis]
MNLPEPPSADGSPADPRLMRASDADRDQVADRLREALAEGRITPEEHSERIDAVYRARTYADLEPVLADLPAGPGAVPAPTVSLRKEEPLPAPVSQGGGIVAIFSGAERRGRWLADPHTNVAAVFGGVELDFRRAVLSQREVTVNVTCVFGGVDITVPPGVRVVNSIAAVLGGVDVPHDDEFAADAPVIHLTGLALFGGVSVKRRETGASRSEARRAERQRRLEEHGRRIREIHDERRENLRALRHARHPRRG